MNVPRFLEGIEREGFYGKIELEYRAGRLTLIRRNETILPDSAGTEPRNGRGVECDRGETSHSRRS